MPDSTTGSTAPAVLFAAGPLEGRECEMALFGQFVGRWDLAVRWYAGGVEVRSARGEWHFAWVLDGRAVQDVWIVPTRVELSRGAELYEYGTSLRFYDPAILAWRSTWHGPVHGVVIPFIARDRDGEIVLEGQREDGRFLRWVFSGITHDAFEWRNMSSNDRSGPWELVQEFTASRAVDRSEPG